MNSLQITVNKLMINIFHRNFKKNTKQNPVETYIILPWERIKNHIPSEEPSTNILKICKGVTRK